MCRTYKTHDNGGRPFRVLVHTRAGDAGDASSRWQITKWTDARVEIYQHEPECDPERLLRAYKHVDVFVPRGEELNEEQNYSLDDDGMPLGDGCAILLHRRRPELRAHRYVLVDTAVVEFTFPEPILEFQAELGLNDVAYPMARTATHLLILWDRRHTPWKALAGADLNGIAREICDRDDLMCALPNECVVVPRLLE